MSRRAKRGSALPRQGEALLDGLFRRLGLLDESRAWRAMAAWPRAIGQALARRTRAERLVGTTLIVRVGSSAWAHELGYLKETLLDKLRATPGGEAVTDLRFSVGLIEDAAPHQAVPAPLERSAAATATPRLDEALEGALAAVADAELRAALRHVIVQAGRRSP